AFMLAFLGVAGFARLRTAERVVGNLTAGAMTLSLLAISVAAVVFATGDHRPERFSVLPVGRSQAFALDLLVDERSLLFVAMSAFICAVVAVFSHRYMHREPGYHRFFFHFNLFALGIFLIGVAGSTT